MNNWTKLSIEYANQRSYLDDLFAVYPTIPDGIREIDEKIWNGIEKAFEKKNTLRVKVKCTKQLPKLTVITTL
jgi:hypothetical protein